ncbi:hypothetical protein [Ammonifex thiophilus]|uniref:hypothetical protein n=1 Tax=Ammonifex thiophilus TaxID=444093 RepID=UPI00106AFDE6|nr:hypothetical protein [Ammonifex thiophilus]
MAKWTIGFEENGKLYKVTKIFTYRDGGFGVAVPYHFAHKGYLFKARVDYTKREQWIPRGEVVEYAASNKVKLSLHLDGFVQFSGIKPGKITSGRDLKSGKPRGLGVQSQPLTNPIKSGPAFGITIWGLSEFEPLLEQELQEKTTIVFWEQDYYLRHCTPEDWNGYILEGFVFERGKYPYLKFEINHNRLELHYVRPFFQYEIPGTIFRLKAIPSQNPHYFISLMVSRIRVGFPSSSGFCLVGPSGEVELDRYGRVVNGTTLCAIYPAPMKDLPSQTLDYKKKKE